MQTITAANLSGLMHPTNQGNKIMIPISLDNIAAYINNLIWATNGLQTQVNQCNQAISNEANTRNGEDNKYLIKANEHAKALHDSLVAKDKALSESLRTTSTELNERITRVNENINGSLQVHDRTLFALDRETKDLKQKLIEEKAKSTILEKKVHYLEGSLQQTQTKADETKNKISELEMVIQMQSKMLAEGQKEQANLKKESTAAIQQLVQNFEAFKDMTKAALKEVSLKNAQLNEQLSEQKANIIQMREMAADIVQEKQQPKQENQRKEKLKARGLTRANSAKILTKQH